MFKIKSLFFCLGLMVVGEIQSCYPRRCYVVRECSDLDYTFEHCVMCAVGGCVALGVGAYLWNRESNNSIIGKVNRLYAPVHCLVSFNLDNVDSFVQNIESTAYDREAIFLLKNCLSNRYASWVKPWDWSCGMQRAYDKIRVVALLYGYLPLLQKTESLNGEDALFFARETFTGMTQYPCMLCLNNLWESMEFAQRNRKNFDSRLWPLIDQILPRLIKAYNILRTEKEYLEELRAKVLQDLQRQILISSYCRR